MHRSLFAAFLALSTAAIAAPAFAEPVVGVETQLGQVLAAADTNMTLYTFTQDAPNQSNCYDNCANAWPPFLAADDAQPEGALGLVTRRDGARQWALNGQPLYFWQGDAAPGDTSGHGVGDVWFVAQN